MGADVRIEIIYFKQDSDIKLEFGLSSEYPIRLLSSKVSDEISFLKRLKTASLRSPIIITVGGFSKKDVYLPEIVAKATNLEMTETDFGKYKTENNGKILLPKGAVPIIYSDGTFNGCVIESGPQSIIMLPEDETNRMKLIKELIVPYISEHYRTFNLTEDSAEEDSIPQELPNNTEQPEEFEENSDLNNLSEEPESSEQPEKESFEELSSGENLNYNEVPLAVQPENLFDKFFLDESEELPEQTNNKVRKRKNKNVGVNIILALSVVVLLGAAAVLGYCAVKYFL